MEKNKSKVKKKKFFFTFDKTKKSQKLKKFFLKKYTFSSIKKADFIIVAGGDGFMLKTIKEFIHYKKPFYGINCGSFGFLMNKFNKKNLEKKILSSKQFFLSPLEVKIKIRKIFRRSLSINEVSLYRQSKQTTSLKIKIGKKLVLKKLIGDGILVSTPAGSTAYNLSVNGPILSLSSKKIAMTPISPFRPRRWKGLLVSNKRLIEIINIDPVKRPVSAVSDNSEFRNISSIKVTQSKKISFSIMFDKSRNLDKRIKLEQLLKNKKNK